MALGVAWLSPGSASAQPGVTKPRHQQPPGGAQQERFVTRHEFNFRDLRMSAEVRILGVTPRLLNQRPNAFGPTRKIRLQSAAVVFPVPPATSIHRPILDQVKGEVEVQGRSADNEPRIQADYQAGDRLAVWDLGETEATSIRLRVDVPMRTHETRVNEELAFAVPWPKNEFPEEVRSALLPQLFVESNDRRVLGLLNRWTNGQPKRAKPYYLAKYLAGRVVEHYQPNGGVFETWAVDDDAFGGTIFTGRVLVAGQTLAGFRVAGAAAAAERGVGPPLDAANLLCAVYRAAGLPARLVIVKDARTDDPGETPAVPPYRALVEFYLYDEQRDFGQWIPVDIEGQRAFSSQAPPLEQRWQYFGHNEDSDNYVPLSFHWHPPTVVVNQGPPALWGWLPIPNDQPASQLLRVYTTGRAITVDDPIQNSPANP
jgi:hypothetical protein